MTTQIDDIDVLFPSPYLKAHDFPTPRVMTMTGISQERMPGGGDVVVLLAFSDSPNGKAMTLNATNKKRIVQLYGRNPSNWWGKQIEAYATETEFKGETVPCIRVRAPGGPVQFAPAQPPRPDAGGFKHISEAIPPHITEPGGEAERRDLDDRLDDEIPF